MPLNLKSGCRFIAAFFLAVIVFSPAVKADRVYTVGYTLPAPHFIEKDEDGLTGFEVEIWQEAARRIGIEYNYKEFANYSAMIQAIEKNKIDFALGTVALDSGHNHKMAFSFPYFVSGQGIMVRRERPQTINQVFSALETPVIWQTFILFLVSTIIFGHIIWFVERRRTNVINEKYFPGVLEGMWCIFATKTTIGYGDIVPHDWRARIVLVPAWLVGLLLITVITAQYITIFTQKEEFSRIAEPFDLVNRAVAVVQESAGTDTATQWGAKIFPVKTVADATRLLLDSKVDAIVHDQLPLTYAASELNQRRALVRVLGPFNTELYSIPMSQKLADQNPSLRDRFKDTIQDLYESGFIDQQKQIWLRSPQTNVMPGGATQNMPASIAR